MRKLIRQPLTWMVIAECIVVVLLVIVVWNVVAAASAQHVGGATIQGTHSNPDKPTSVRPDVTKAARPAAPGQLPGLNLSPGFWRTRLGQLNRDQVFFEQ